MALFFKWLEYITIFILFQDTLSHRTRLRNVILIILIAAGIVGIDGLIQKISGIEFLRQRPIGWARNQTYAITGPFNHYNDLGAYLVIILSLAVALLVSGQIKKIYKWVLTTLGILLWLCLLLTFSRGAWLGLISSLFLMLVLSPKNKKWILLCITFITVIIFLIPAARERYLFTFGLGGDADRFAVWQIAFRMIKENPFLGKGIGTFMDYFSIHARGLVVQYAHNCFLQIWAETGIFSLLSFILFIGLILYKGIKAFKERTDFLLFGLICGIFGFLVHSFFDTQFYSLQLATLFWSMLGLLMAVINLKVQNKKI
jgi:putative inorganic carbon (HCO3(-)) transporter